MVVFLGLRGIALSWLVLVPSALESGGDDFAAGVKAYRDGKPKAAMQALLSAERAAGERAAPELLYDLAIAALATGDLRRAEIAAEHAAVRGPAAFTGLRDFVHGNTAFARCTREELQASGPEAEPFAFEIALGHAASALASWQSAATSRSDWPEARRNVELAQRKLAELQQKKAAAQQRQDAKKAKPKDPEPERRKDTERSKDELATPKPQAGDEGAVQVQVMLERLVKKDLEKREVRRSQQQLRVRVGEKDW